MGICPVGGQRGAGTGAGAGTRAGAGVGQRADRGVDQPATAGTTSDEMAIDDETRRRMHDHARTLIAAIEPYAEQWAGMGVTVTNGPFALHLGRLAGAVGDHERARHLLTGAMNATRDADATAWLARCLLALAEVPIVATEERRRPAREAVDLAVELRQADVARRARAALVSLGEEILPAGLTRREAEVLAQIALGATNREAADRLFVSVKTVERHLLNAYSKLGVRTRTEAAAWVLRHGLAAVPEPERG
jgi:DNA-binding CsgD family transcriptional regulator